MIPLKDFSFKTHLNTTMIYVCFVFSFAQSPHIEPHLEPTTYN